MAEHDYRWQQRFENFERAYRRLDEGMKDFDNLSVLEKEGLIQRFEYTFELAWKTLKDYLRYQQVVASYPREVIKTAFQYGLIIDGDIWMDMLDKRNLLAHTYSEERFQAAISMIREQYFDAMSRLYQELRGKV